MPGTDDQGEDCSHDEGGLLEGEQPDWLRAASLDLSQRQSMPALEDEPDWLRAASLDLSRRQSMDLPCSQSPEPAHDTVDFWSGTPSTAPALSGVDSCPPQDLLRCQSVDVPRSQSPEPAHDTVAWWSGTPSTAAAPKSFDRGNGKAPRSVQREDDDPESIERRRFQSSLQDQGMAKPGARGCSLGEIASSWWLGLPFVSIIQAAPADTPSTPLADSRKLCEARAEAAAASTTPPPFSSLQHCSLTRLRRGLRTWASVVEKHWQLQRLRRQWHLSEMTIRRQLSYAWNILYDLWQLKEIAIRHLHFSQVLSAWKTWCLGVGMSRGGGAQGTLTSQSTWLQMEMVLLDLQDAGESLKDLRTKQITEWQRFHQSSAGGDWRNRDNSSLLALVEMRQRLRRRAAERDALGQVQAAEQGEEGLADSEQCTGPTPGPTPKDEKVIANSSSDPSTGSTPLSSTPTSTPSRKPMSEGDSNSIHETEQAISKPPTGLIASFGYLRSFTSPYIMSLSMGSPSRRASLERARAARDSVGDQSMRV